MYKQTLRTVKVTTGKKGKETELTGKGPLRRRRSALDCSATEGPHWTVVPPKEKKKLCLLMNVIYSGILHRIEFSSKHSVSETGSPSFLRYKVSLFR